MRARALGATVAVAIAALLLSACTASHDHAGSGNSSTVAGSSTEAPTTASSDHHGGGTGGMTGEMTAADRASAMLATAAYQDVAVAEAAGYASSLDSLGCFQNPEQGGMGVHYIDQALMDATVDITKPEALVYELDADGAITGLVAHEYIVPIEAWTAAEPPTLFGMDFHQHPTLPLWVLHTWLWKENPHGVFDDWNPAVRLCPAGVPIFGAGDPATSSATASATAPATS